MYLENLCKWNSTNDCFWQMLTITLDESDCFAAWVSAKDAGFSSPDGSDPKRESVSFLLFLLAQEKVGLLGFAMCSSSEECSVWYRWPAFS